MPASQSVAISMRNMLSDGADGADASGHVADHGSFGTGCLTIAATESGAGMEVVSVAAAAVSVSAVSGIVGGEYYVEGFFGSSGHDI